MESICRGIPMNKANQKINEPANRRIDIRHSPTYRGRMSLATCHLPLATHHSPLTTHQSGFSLLEVLIASAILIFGIVAIVKIFPAGLGVIQQNENAQVAARLAESVQESYARQKGELPDAVVAVNADGSFNTAIDPESTTDDGTTNSIDSVRRVVGETHEVLSNGNVIVNFPQIDFDPNDSFCTDCTSVPPSALILTDPDLRNPRVYREVPLTEVGAAPSPLEFQPNANLTTGRLYFNAANAGQYVRISYTWIDTSNPHNGQSYYVEGERQLIASSSPYDVVVSARTATIPGLGTLEFGQVLPRSWRVVMEAPVAIANTVIDGDSDTIRDQKRQVLMDNFRRGVIPLSGVTVGQEVKVDYAVNDWRWVTETSTVGANGVVDLVFEDVLADEGMHIASVATGESIAPASTDYLTGIVTFNVSLAGTVVRLTYRTGEEWLVQMVKAPATFTNAITTDPEWYRVFADRYWQTADTGVTDYQKALGFPQINAGNTVVVDYVADNPGGSPTPTNSSDDKTFYGEMHAINPDEADYPVFANFPYEVKLYNNYREIIAVRGVSTIARVAWGDKARIRMVEVPTYLTRR
ncbi:MAG: hypothetical protein COZ05_14825 [Armatimonadetes bacterium CG_4_10_14_3_um_filter_59_10]|nr:MAG: hypothetical protein COZ05_14825 [Armatimonadetes bacterium CG_4_10_14_3_um_filter_59_10]PJB63274.1 MAG: hypothetical protein CO095_16860 [Armatimonadetes bacterium CG_4_9_14_3_um_filter_58_7]